MSTALAFDTLKLADALEQVNLPREQARAIVEVVRESHDFTLSEQSRLSQAASEQTAERLDTKTEKAIALSQAETGKAIALLRNDMEAGFLQIRNEMDIRFEQMRNEMNARFAQMHNEMDARFLQTDRTISMLRKDMETGFALMDKKIELVDQNSKSRFRLLYWMFGGMVAALFAVAATLAPAALRVYFGG